LPKTSGQAWLHEREHLGGIQKPIQSAQIGCDQRADAGPAHLHRYQVAVFQPGLIDAGKRSGADRLRIEDVEHLIKALAEIALDDLDRLLRRKRGSAVEHLPQLCAIGIGQDVGAKRQLLTELEEACAGVLEHPPQAHRPFLNAVATAQKIKDHARIETYGAAQPGEQPQQRPDRSRLEKDPASHGQGHGGTDQGGGNFPARHRAQNVHTVRLLRRVSRCCSLELLHCG
jgi:hypothetical protein